MARRRLKDVLSVDEFVALRQRGVKYVEIGRMFGFAENTVCQYGNKVLPEELRGWLKGNGAKPKSEPVEEGCVRCGNKEDYVNPNDGLCVRCKREMAHGAGFLDDPGRIRAKVRATAALAKRKAKERAVATEATSPAGPGDTSEEPSPQPSPILGEGEEAVVTGGGSSPTEDDTSERTWEGWSPEALESLRAEVDGVGAGAENVPLQGEMERLELLARVKEAEKDAAFWCDRAVRLALKLADLQAEHAAEMQQVARQLEEVGKLLNRAEFLPLLERVGMTLVVKPKQLEEAVQAWTGERMLVIRGVVC